MKPYSRFQAGLCLLLLGMTLQSVVPFALEPDHWHDHHSSANQAAGERVLLHDQDGDHHHEGLRLELGEKSSHPTCVLCAHIGKSPALLIKRVGSSVTLDASSSLSPEAVFVRTDLGKQPYQPRAPPCI